MHDSIKAFLHCLHSSSSLLFLSLASLNCYWELSAVVPLPPNVIFRAAENTENSCQRSHTTKTTESQSDFFFLSLHKCKFNALTCMHMDQKVPGTASQQCICNRLLSIISDHSLIAFLLFRPQHIDSHESWKCRMSQILKISAKWDVSVISWICHRGATQYPQTDWAGGRDGSVDTSFCISPFNDIIFHFPCKRQHHYQMQWVGTRHSATDSRPPWW